MTRPQRHFIFGAILVLLIAVVTLGVIWPHDGGRRLLRLPVGSRVVHFEDHSMSVYGLTGWLIVTEGPGGRNVDLNPIGTMEALMVIAAAVAIGVWGHRRLVAGLRLPRGRCDNCGYDLRGLDESARCPECGDDSDAPGEGTDP